MKLIIFDMDGLMFDTEAIGFRAYEEVGKEWGLSTGFDIYETLIGVDKRDTCERYRQLYGADMDAELFYRQVGDRIQEIMDREGIPMKPGLLPLLDAIEEAKQSGVSKWNGKIPANLKTPLRDGDEERPDDPAYANSYFFNCSSNPYHLKTEKLSNL